MRKKMSEGIMVCGYRCSTTTLLVLTIVCLTIVCLTRCGIRHRIEELPKVVVNGFVSRGAIIGVHRQPGDFECIHHALFDAERVEVTGDHQSLLRNKNWLDIRFRYA